jgi:hypothetical protein
MTNQKKYRSGDHIYADRLNRTIQESEIPRREIMLGMGSSLVNETLGNQSANMRKPFLKLVVAVEDFSIQEVTDLAATAIDDAPSGLVSEVRLNRASGTHGAETLTTPFRAWDPVAGLSGAFCDSESASEDVDTAWKSACDVFYIAYNEDSKRWEVLSAGSSSVLPKTAITRACLGFGWYRMELTDNPAGCAPGSESVSSSVSDVDGCDICAIAEAEDPSPEATGCANTPDSGRQTPTGNGTFVYARDLRVIPLKIGGEALIQWTGETCSSSESSGEAVTSNRVYYVQTGEYEIVRIPHEVWECCPLTGEPKMIQCWSWIVEGARCEGETDPCPSESV